MFASVLVAEETTDRLQRESMHDERVQPMLRAVSRVHVVEEARHVRFAREELARLVPTLSRAALERERWLTALVSTEVVNALVQARVYRAVGTLRAGRARRGAGQPAPRRDQALHAREGAGVPAGGRHGRRTVGARLAARRV